MANKPLGYQALIARFSLKVPPLRETSELADKTGVMSSHTHHDGTRRFVYPKNRYRGDDSVIDQLTFALKREQLNLTVLAALFEQAEARDAVQAWLRQTPSSRYARLSAFYGKWLAGVEFDYALPAGTPRIPALDAKRYFVGPETLESQFGIINNLIGTPNFCPLIRRTEKLAQFLATDLPGKLEAAIRRLEPELF